MLLRAHWLRFRLEKPFILLVAEKDTLDKVLENFNVVKFLNRMKGVKATVICPEDLEKRGDSCHLYGTGGGHQSVTILKTKIPVGGPSLVLPFPGYSKE